MSAASSLPAPWRELAEAAGGVGKLAEAFGVSPRTIHRWAHGERTPSVLEQRGINAWALAHKCKAPYRVAA